MKMRDFTVGVGVGLIAGYFWDPARGRHRRALGRDKMTRLVRTSRERFQKNAIDKANRTLGVVSEAASLVDTETADDRVVAERVRSEIGRTVSHPGSITVSVENGQVRLTGPVLTNEFDALMRTVMKVKGVKNVESHLDVQDQPGNLPGLQS